MYLPPYKQLLSATTNYSDGKDSDQVAITLGFLKFLLQAALAASDFDEDRYLAENPDVRSSLASNNHFTPAQHYIGFGYFEGRRGGMPKVDEQWYLQTYRDVGDAVRDKRIASATEHFETAGASEGRAPSREYVDVANQWKKLLS